MIKGENQSQRHIVSIECLLDGGKVNTYLAH
jgi:hypothetical protein